MSTKVESVQNGHFLKSPIFVLEKAAAPFKVEFSPEAPSDITSYVV